MKLSTGKNSFTRETRRATTEEKNTAINLLAKYLEENSEPQSMGFVPCVAGIAISKIYPDFATLKLSSADDSANSLFKLAANKLKVDNAWLEEIEAEADKMLHD